VAEERAEKRPEGGLLGEALQLTRKGQGPVVERVGEALDKLPAKHLAQHLHRKKEGRARVHPLRAVRRKASSGDHAVDMWMVQQRLAPGVEDAQETDRRPEVPGRARDLEERLGTRAEEQVVHDPLVLQGKPRQRVWQGEDDMGVSDRQQLALTLGQPRGARAGQTLRAMPVATRIVRDGTMVTPRPAIEMAAQRGCAAARQRAEHAAVQRRQPRRVCFDEPIAVGANDVGHLEGGPGHRFRFRRVRRTVSA
jgi:hypothetical protein